MNPLHLRVGVGHDTHRLGAERPLILGGVTVPHTSGLVGHSDADVLLHAVTDAFLGAMGAGDIGELFPDTDPLHKDADSAKLLREAISRQKEPFQIINLDCIVFAQLPKLSPYKLTIRDSLAKLLEIPPDRVSVKAKTGELVGPIGRQEAISAEAVILVYREGLPND